MGINPLAVLRLRTNCVCSFELARKAGAKRKKRQARERSDQACRPEGTADARTRAAPSSPERKALKERVCWYGLNRFSMACSVCILHSQKSKPSVLHINSSSLSSRFAPNDNRAERRPIPTFRPPPFPRPDHRPTGEPLGNS